MPDYIQNNTNSAYIQQAEDTNPIVNTINQYIRKGKYLLKNKEIPTGEYTIPTIVLASALGPYIAGKPVIAGIEMLGASLGGKTLDKISEAITDKDVATNVSEATGLDTEASELLNPGYYGGPKLLKKLLAKGAGEVISAYAAKQLAKAKIPEPNLQPKQIYTIPTETLNKRKAFSITHELTKHSKARQSKLTLAERLGVPKSERNLPYRHPNHGTITQASDDVYIFNRTSDPYDFSIGRQVWKYPKRYYEDDGSLFHNRYTNHWTLKEPVLDHGYGSWATASTTMAYPYRQAVFDNGLPADIEVFDTFWASPNYFTLQGSKARVLTSDYAQYMKLKKQGVNVEFSKEGSDILSKINDLKLQLAGKQYPNASEAFKDPTSKLIGELAERHDAIHRNWAKQFSKNMTQKDMDVIAKEIGYEAGIIDFNHPLSSPTNHAGSPFAHGVDLQDYSPLYRLSRDDVGRFYYRRDYLAPVYKRMVHDYKSLGIDLPTKTNARNYLRDLSFDDIQPINEYFSPSSIWFKDNFVYGAYPRIFNSSGFRGLQDYLTRNRKMPFWLHDILYKKLGGKFITKNSNNISNTKYIDGKYQIPIIGYRKNRSSQIFNRR